MRNPMKTICPLFAAALVLTACDAPLPPQEPAASDDLKQYVEDYRNESLRKEVGREAYIRENMAHAIGKGFSQGMNQGGCAPKAKTKAKAKPSAKKTAPQADTAPVKPSSLAQSFA